MGGPLPSPAHTQTHTHTPQTQGYLKCRPPRPASFPPSCIRKTPPSAHCFPSLATHLFHTVHQVGRSREDEGVPRVLQKVQGGGETGPKQGGEGGGSLTGLPLHAPMHTVHTVHTMQEASCKPRPMLSPWHVSHPMQRPKCTCPRNVFAVNLALYSAANHAGSFWAASVAASAGAAGFMRARMRAMVAALTTVLESRTYAGGGLLASLTAS
jgi:hypothetical protein